MNGEACSTRDGTESSENQESWNGCAMRPIQSTDNYTIHKKPDSKDTEIWEVTQLRGNMETVSKPSAAIQRLFESRKSRHDDVMMKMGEEITNVNLQTENNIRLSSEELKAHMKMFKEKLDEIYKQIDQPELALIPSNLYRGIQLEKGQFRNIQTIVDEMKSQQSAMVEELYQDFLKFEAERVKANESIFHARFEEIRKNTYLLPYELQSLIEHETLKMNQLILNNRRCYEDLRLHLILLTENTFKTFMDKVYCAQEKWVRHQIFKAQQHMRKEAEAKAAVIMPEPCTRLELQDKPLELELTAHGIYSTCTSKKWQENIMSVISSLDSYGRNVVELYKKALEAVLGNFNNEMEDLKREICSVEVLNIQERVIQPLIIQAQEEKLLEVTNMESYWQDVLAEVRTIAQEVVSFLLDIGALWDRHNIRLCESKALVMKALEKGQENNRSSVQELEIKLNLALDATRQEHNRAKLDKAYDLVRVLLRDIRVKIEDGYLSEVATVEDFYKMVILESDVLCSELREFLYSSYPGTEFDESEPVTLRAAISRPGMAEHKFLHKHIKYASARIAAIKTWKYGVWKAMEIFSKNTRKLLEPKAEEWVKMKIDELAEKMEAQMEIHERRYDRIKVEIYETRLSEIQEHAKAFERHKLAVKEAYLKLRKDLMNLVETEIEKYSRNSDIVYEIERSSVKDNTAGIVRRKIINVEQKRKDFFKASRITFDCFRGDCESKINCIKQSNLNFMKAIKLFNERGNYNSDEAKTYINGLEAISKSSSGELTNILASIEKEEAEMIKKGFEMYDSSIRKLKYVCHELEFNAAALEKINYYHKDIRETALDFKSDYMLFKRQANHALEPLENGFPLSEEESPLWKPLTMMLYKIVGQLFYPIEYPVTPEPSIEGESTKEEAPPAIMVDIPSKEGKPKPFVPFPVKDYRAELLKTTVPFESDKTFMGNICEKLWNHMGDIQQLACDFYQKIGSRPVIRDDIVPHSYDSFAHEVLVKFQYFEMQCEQLWLQTIIDFLHILGRIKVGLNVYAERLIKDYKLKAADEVQQHYFDLTAKLKTFKNQTDQELDNLDKRLMPLHGHPNNEKLLAELEEDVVSTTARLSVTWQSILAMYTEQLQEMKVFHIKLQTLATPIKEFYSHMSQLIFKEELGEQILEKVLEHCTNGGYVKRALGERIKVHKYPKIYKDKDRGEAYSLSSGEVLSKHKLDIATEGVKSESIRTYLSELKSLVEWERTDIREQFPALGFEPTAPTSLHVNSPSSSRNGGLEDWYRKPKMNVLATPNNCEELVRDALTQINDLISEMKKSAKLQYPANDQFLKQWLDVWKLNVKKVLQLYTVRYPCTEAEPVSPTSSGCSPLAKARLRKKLDFEDHITGTNQKNRPVGLSRSFSTEHNTCSDIGSFRQINFTKSNLPIRYHEQARYASNSSLGSLSPSKSSRLSQIPIPSRLSGQRSCLRLKERSPSPVKRKSYSDYRVKILGKQSAPDTEFPSTKNKVKKIDFQPTSRSPSPTKLPTAFTYSSKWSKTRNLASKTRASSDTKETEDPQLLPSPKKDDPLLENKDGNKSESFSSVSGFIRTTSGNKLVLTPSMEYEIAHNQESDEVAISELLQQTDDKFTKKNYSDIRVIGDDDANEYDSEATTDCDLRSTASWAHSDVECKRRKPKSAKRMNSFMTSSREAPLRLWKSQEEELINDIAYKQSVYHPTVLRRTQEKCDGDDFLLKSTEDDFSYTMMTEKTILRNSSKNCFKNREKSPPTYQMISDATNPILMWNDKSDKLDSTSSSFIIDQTKNVTLKLDSGKRLGRRKSKRERIAGAILRITARFIRLLALFNLWSGDYCHLLTSHGHR